MNFAQVKGITIPQGAVKQLAQGQTVLWKKQGGGEIWPPASYTRLEALKKANNSAFFNTGVMADSSTNFDIFFSNNDSNTNNLQAAFGIRRLSGSSDTKRVCLYTRTGGYWSSHAANYGTVDTGAITASGAAVKFGGNLMKISVKGGKWYEWDRLIYDGTAQSFSNTDSVPFFLGTAAKNATTVYISSSIWWAFHEAIFYDSQGNVAHRFLPYLDASNQKGFWDTIEGSFTLVNNQSHWTAISTYSLRSLRLTARFNAMGSASFQSCVEKNGWKVAVTDSQRYFYLTNEKYEIHSGSWTQPGRILQCSEYNNNWHGNTAWWGDTYADPNDFFPLLYVGTDKSNHQLNVYRLAGDDPSTCTISLVQKINTPEGDSAYGSTLFYHNYYGKEGCGTFVQTAYTKNSYTSNTGDYVGNVVMYRVFSLPALSAGSVVTLTEADALAKGDLGFISTTQNGGWNGKYLNISYLHYLVFWEIDGNGASPAKTVDYYTTTSPDFISGNECEGFAWNEDGGFFVTLWQPSTGDTFDTYADDLKPYAEGTYNFGQ